MLLRKRCTCSPLDFDRIKRSGWVRLLVGFRAYRCKACGSQFLAPKRTIDRIAVKQRQEAFAHRRQST